MLEMDDCFFKDQISVGHGGILANYRLTIRCVESCFRCLNERIIVSGEAQACVCHQRPNLEKMSSRNAMLSTAGNLYTNQVDLESVPATSFIRRL